MRTSRISPITSCCSRLASSVLPLVRSMTARFAWQSSVSGWRWPERLGQPVQRLPQLGLRLLEPTQVVQAVRPVDGAGQGELVIVAERGPQPGQRAVGEFKRRPHRADAAQVGGDVVARRERERVLGAEGFLVGPEHHVRGLVGGGLVVERRLVAGEVQLAGEGVRLARSVGGRVALAGLAGELIRLVDPAHLPQRHGQALGRAQRVDEVLAEDGVVTLVGGA